jgi:hypothetical protein
MTAALPEMLVFRRRVVARYGQSDVMMTSKPERTFRLAKESYVQRAGWRQSRRDPMLDTGRAVQTRPDPFSAASETTRRTACPGKARSIIFWDSRF